MRRELGPLDARSLAQGWLKVDSHEAVSVSWIQTSVVLVLGRGADAVEFEDVESSDFGGWI